MIFAKYIKQNDNNSFEIHLKIVAFNLNLYCVNICAGIQTKMYF